MIKEPLQGRHHMLPLKGFRNIRIGSFTVVVQPSRGCVGFFDSRFVSGPGFSRAVQAGKGSGLQRLHAQALQPIVLKRSCGAARL